MKNRNYQAGDILWVNMPRQNGSVQCGRRPCVCLGNRKGLRNSTVITVIPLSSRCKAMHLPVHVLLEGEKLPQKSIAMAEQITTVSKDSITGYIGTVSEKMLHAIQKAALIQLGIAV